MLFVLTGYFREGVEAERNAIHERFNEHLMQRAARTKLGGALYDEKGVRSGVLLVVEVADYAAAEAFFSASPYLQAGLYERTEISEIGIEVGSLR